MAVKAPEAAKITRRLRIPKQRPTQTQVDTGILGYNRAVPYLFSGPATLLVGLILGFPVVYSIWQSFYNAKNLATPAEFIPNGPRNGLLRVGGYHGLDSTSSFRWCGNDAAIAEPYKGHMQGTWNRRGRER